MKKAFVFAMLFSTPAFAQSNQIDEARFLNSVVPIIQQQRNASLDAAASAEAKIAILQTELAAAKKRIEELEKLPAKKE